MHLPTGLLCIHFPKRRVRTVAEAESALNDFFLSFIRSVRRLSSLRARRRPAIVGNRIRCDVAAAEYVGDLTPLPPPRTFPSAPSPENYHRAHSAPELTPTNVQWPGGK